MGARIFHGLISKERLTGMLVGIGFLVLAPYLHLGVFFNYWTKKKNVDKKACLCSCWDKFFKGSYEGETDSVSKVSLFCFFERTAQILPWAGSTICEALGTSRSEAPLP